jgi:pimeloyl-ACP methyl ester carboxylesterase
MQAGYVALTFDYRGFGESEGPKWRLIPAEQMRDIWHATTFLAAQETVDPDRLGIYGTSFGGGNAALATATDPRLKCLVSVGGVSDGEAWLRDMRRYWEWREFLKRLEADRLRRVMTGESEWVETYDVMVPDPATVETHKGWFETAPHRRYQLLLETADAVIDHRPIASAHLIAPRPARWIHVEGDWLVPMEQSIRIYERAGEPKELILLPGGLRHHDVYQGPGLERVAGLAVDWFRTHLPSRA